MDMPICGSYRARSKFASLVLATITTHAQVNYLFTGNANLDLNLPQAFEYRATGHDREPQPHVASNPALTMIGVHAASSITHYYCVSGALAHPGTYAMVYGA